MDVLRQDVEAMEKEMEELRAYLAKTDDNREDEEHTLKDGDINYQEAGKNTIRPSAATVVIRELKQLRRRRLQNVS